MAGGGPTKCTSLRLLSLVHSAFLRGAGHWQSPPALEVHSGGCGSVHWRREHTASAPGRVGNSPKVGRKKIRRLRRDRKDAVPRRLRRGSFPLTVVGGTGWRGGPLPSDGQPRRPPCISSHLTEPVCFPAGIHTSRRGHRRLNGCIRPVLKHEPRFATRVRVFGQQTRRAQ